MSTATVYDTFRYLIQLQGQMWFTKVPIWGPWARFIRQKYLVGPKTVIVYFEFVENIFISFYLFILIFCLFRAAPGAYGGSQAGGQIRAVAAGLHQTQQCWIQAVSATYTTARGTTRSVIH